ncbi:protein unc-93 homolog A-like [Haliotis rubra]|uniref:protein unc-93 homolog A-like n=1 Tax=Haliotis rubra TaxID=36100 RepID=UPI001EE57AFE|nr:protein unc-93 homolog A-like [Haliotis rubra]
MEADNHTFRVETEEPPSPLSGKETKNTIVLGLGFLFVFASYLSLQNLQGSLNDEGGLGVLSLSCLYGAAILSAIYAPTCITVVGVKRSMMIAFTGHLIYVASNFYPSFATLIPSSIILGAVTGPLWTSLGMYLTSCAISASERTGMELTTSLSRTNGIFFGMFELCNIVGNLLSSLVLYQGQYNSTNINSSAFCGANDCPQEETVDIIADPEPTVVYILLRVFLGCVATGLGVVSVFLQPIQHQSPANKNTIRKSLWSWFRLIIQMDIKFLLPFMLYTAIEEVVVFTELTKSYVSCPFGIQNVGYVMTAYGVCSASSSFLFSKIAKYARRYVLLGLAAVLQMVLMLWLYHWVPSHHDIHLVYVISSVWGVSEGIWKTQTNSVLGEIFQDNKQSAFAVYEGFKSIAFTCIFVYSSMLCTSIKLIIAMTFLVLGMTLYALAEVRYLKRSPQRTSEDDNEEAAKFETAVS